MGPRERREREREEIRTRILDAARELFANEGVESVTMRRIAERIEYSPTAIYFHFRDKESLLAELCDCDFRAMAQQFVALGEVEDPIERMRLTAMAYLDFGLNNPSHYRVMFMTPKPPHEPIMDAKGNPEEDAYEFLLMTVRDAIAKGRFRPELNDPDLIAQVMWAGVHGVVSLEIAKCNDPWVDWRPIRDRATLMFDTLIDGMTVISEQSGSRQSAVDLRSTADRRLPTADRNVKE